MTAWLVTTVEITDPEAFGASGYVQAAAAALERCGGEYVVRAPGATVIEGEGPEGEAVLVTRWPSRDAALAFLASPETAAAKALRVGIGRIRSLLVGT